MIWFLISILFALFMNTSLAPAMGFEAVTTTAFLPMMLLIVKETISSNIKYNLKINNPALIVLGFAVIVFIIKLILRQDYFKPVLTFLIMPVLMSIYFETCSEKKIRVLQNVVLFFFFVECALAIYERVTLQYVFFVDIKESEYFNTENWEFRSQAFLGHPLANAMVVAVLMVFIITNKKLKTPFKAFSALLGYITLLCFNARGATIITTAFTIPYLFYNTYTSSKGTYKLIYVLVFFVLISGIFQLVFNTDFGGRLTKGDKLLDDSAMSRLDVFRFYLFIDTQDLLWGNPDSYMYVTKKLGAGGVENGVVALILQYGIILTIPILVLLFRFQLQKLQVYVKIEQWLILAVFYIIGTINPNLEAPIQWTIFIFGYYAFRNVKFAIGKRLSFNSKEFERIN